MFFYYGGLVLILTVIISLLIMVLSDRWTMLQKDKMADENNGDREKSGDTFAPESLEKKVFEIINKAVKSSGYCFELTETILDIVDKESDKIFKVKNYPARDENS